MPVMRRLHVGGTTYDTVGEASVTQVLSSGTKIATVSIDGTSTDLYAPAGGSSVDPATATPSMDGTAAVGSSAKYAREDHVHPTDTSRQATLVSGTNIKTVMGSSLLGSGNVALPTASTSTLGGVKVDGTTITAAADGTISASGGGGGDPYDLVVNVTVSAAGAVLSHDAVYADCLAFAKAAVSGQDVHAVAFCRSTSYDDEDEIYGAVVEVLPFVYANTSSYGVGQYEADGGWHLNFIAMKGVTSGRAYGRKLSIGNSNDDPDLGLDVTYTTL